MQLIKLFLDFKPENTQKYLNHNKPLAEAAHNFAAEKIAAGKMLIRQISSDYKSNAGKKESESQSVDIVRKTDINDVNDFMTYLTIAKNNLVIYIGADERVENVSGNMTIKELLMEKIVGAFTQLRENLCELAGEYQLVLRRGNVTTVEISNQDFLKQVLVPDTIHELNSGRTFTIKSAEQMMQEAVARAVNQAFVLHPQWEVSGNRLSTIEDSAHEIGATISQEKLLLITSRALSYYQRRNSDEQACTDLKNQFFQALSNQADSYIKARNKGQFLQKLFNDEVLNQISESNRQSALKNKTYKQILAVNAGLRESKSIVFLREILSFESAEQAQFAVYQLQLDELLAKHHCFDDELTMLSPIYQKIQKTLSSNNFELEFSDYILCAKVHYLDRQLENKHCSRQDFTVLDSRPLEVKYFENIGGTLPLFRLQYLLASATDPVRTALLKKYGDRLFGTRETPDSGLTNTFHGLLSLGRGQVQNYLATKSILLGSSAFLLSNSGAAVAASIAKDEKLNTRTSQLFGKPRVI